MDVGGTARSSVQQSLHGRLPRHLHHDVVLAGGDFHTAIVQAAKKPGSTLVFANDASSAVEVGDALAEAGVQCGVFASAGMSMAAKRRLLKRANKGSLKVLVTTDALGRGIDLPGVTRVINVQCPPDAATYLHRAGRAGRLQPAPAARPGAPASAPAQGKVLTVCDNRQDMLNTTIIMHALGADLPGDAEKEQR